MKQIEIHEFSTGITVEGNENNWFSRGFTGQYMNATLEEIPAVVQKAISNREFAVAERASTDNPTLIAREIGDKQEEWSVIAVVTRARDDFGRYLSVYRYFLTEGRGNMATILRWMNNKPLVFDPFDTKEIGKVHHYSDQENTTIPIDNFQEFITEEIPVIIPFNKRCSPLIINSIAQEKAGDKLVAWAHNVTGLEVPKSFYVIYPASRESEENLRKIISNQSNNDGKIISGEGIKKAISGLISRDKVKLEHLQTLEEALTNEDIEPKYWEDFFNSRGAKDAISQKLYSAQMVRLLTLKSMFIPDSLPTFLYWMENRQSKDIDHWETSLTFQINIGKELRPIVENSPQLSAKIEDGIKLILLRLLDEPELLKSAVKLLENKKGIWGNFYRYGIKEYLDNDLSLMSQAVRFKQSNLTTKLEKLDFKLKSNTDWDKIFNELANFWQPYAQKNSIEKYQVWGELFEHLQDYQLSAFFYHVASTKVPKSVFCHLRKFSWGNGYDHQVYKVIIQREMDLLESFILEIYELFYFLFSKILKIGGFKVKLWLVLILLILSATGGFVSKTFLFKSPLEEAIKKNKDKIETDLTNKKSLISQTFECYSKDPQKCEITYKEMTEKQLQKAKDNFAKTQESLKELFKKTDQVKAIFSNQNINLDNINKEQEKWITAIYEYQENNQLKPDGIIDKNGDTYNKLKEDLKTK